MRTLFLILILALGLQAHETATAQTVASCPTATPGSTWNPKTQWLECSDLTYIAEPIPATVLINDMRCNHVTNICVFTWMLPAHVLPTDQTWVKTTARPNGTWVASSTLRLLSGAAPPQNCTTLVYIGKPLTVTGMAGTPDDPFPIIPLVGTVLLSFPLLPNLANQEVILGYGVAWDFSTEFGQHYFLSEQAGYYSNPITFTTDANGNIIAWNMTLRLYGGGIAGTGMTVISTQDGDTVSVTGTDPAHTGTVHFSATGTNTTPGTWICLADLIAETSSLQSQVSD
jgi:hypothetical protein